MKAKFITILLVLMALTLSASAQTQKKRTRKLTPKEALQLGDKYMNGINTEVDYNKALKIYKALDRAGNAKGINRLAGMYRHGFGTAQNLDSAACYYRKASNLGNGKATFNLMNLYRMGEGVEQNFDSAFVLAAKAYEQGYTKKAVFTLGYLSFKGLGTPQSYEKALEYFQIGADKGSTICLYYIGFFHVAGYGVPQDIDKGMALIVQAADKGNDAAVAFINENRVEKYRPSALRAIKTRAPYLKRHNTARDSLSGVWEGKLLQYDWSGKRVMKEQKLALQLDFAGDRLSGIWVQDDSVSMRVSGHLEDSVWVFDHMRYFADHIERSWDVRSGGFQITAGSETQSIDGSIEQYSPTTKEPAPPTAMSLTRKSYDSKGSRNKQSLNSLTVQPNPFDRELQITLTLTEEQQFTLLVYDTEGQVVHKSWGYCSGGIYRQSLQLDVPTGTYCVSVKGTTVNLNTLVIKK